MQCQKLKTYMETGRVVFLPPRSIRPNPAQPRKIFREQALEELAESIRQHGVLQPCRYGGWATPTSSSPGSGGSGRRRWRG